MHLPLALHRHPRARRALRDAHLRPDVGSGGQRARYGAPGAKTLRVRNRTRGTILAARCRVADDAVSRAVGLLLSPPLEPGTGLLLTRTSAITMLGMRFAIDVAFVDDRWGVVDVEPALAPWVPVRLARGADATLELPVGALAASGTEVGDELVVEAAE